MGAIPCFLIEPTGLYEVSLRRYASRTGDDGNPIPGAACPLTRTGVHDATVVIGEAEAHAERPTCGDLHPHDDPRWPAACACGYAFADGDTWQRNYSELYRSPSGGLYTINGWGRRPAPAGAIWRAEWLEDAYRGADGRAYLVRTPDGDWCPEWPSSNTKTPWTRTGQAPRFTCTPSIWMNAPHGWHGWLRDGVLVSA